MGEFERRFFTLGTGSYWRFSNPRKMEEIGPVLGVVRFLSLDYYANIQNKYEYNHQFTASIGAIIWYSLA